MNKAPWYVYAQGRFWGPYAPERITAFVKEGRVTASTLIAQTPDGPVRTAAHEDAFAAFFDHAKAIPPQADIQIPDQEAAETGGAARALLVFAMLVGLEESAFEAALAMHGPHERLGAGLWLVRARLGPAALRNALSRRLRGGDRLVVVEAGLDQAAWFNLDQGEERRLRALWGG